VQIALQRTPAPFSGPRAQFLVGQRLRFDHGVDCDGEVRSQSDASCSSIPWVPALKTSSSAMVS
jgi:hypothetical protein